MAKVSKSQASQNNCLLCNAKFNPKLSIGPSKSNSSAPDPFKFSQSFKLFCSLLTTNSSDLRQFGTCSEVDSFQKLYFIKVKGLPCCGDCCASLDDLVRLQEVIEKNLAKQREIVESLKVMVVANDNFISWNEPKTGDFWAPIKTQLVRSLLPNLAQHVKSTADNDPIPEEEQDSIMEPADDDPGYLNPPPSPPEDTPRLPKSKFQCFHCPKTFPKSCHLSKHMRINHRILKPPQKKRETKGTFICSICGKLWPTEPDLAKHIESHSVESSCFKCRFCPKRLASSSTLERHERVHLEKEQVFT